MGDYALRFTARARRQIEDLLVGSRLRQWREESVVRLSVALKKEPMRFGEGRASDAGRVWFFGGLAVEYYVDEPGKRVTVFHVRVRT